jgi:hypothetical protein
MHDARPGTGAACAAAEPHGTHTVAPMAGAITPAAHALQFAPPVPA